MRLIYVAYMMQLSHLCLNDWITAELSTFINLQMSFVTQYLMTFACISCICSVCVHLGICLFIVREQKDKRNH